MSPEPPPPEGETVLDRRRRRRRVIVLAVAAGLVVGGVVWAGLVVRSVVRAADQARVAEAALDDLRDLSDLEAVVEDGTVGPQLREAADAFSAASDELTRPWMAPIGWLPFVGRNLDAAEDLAEAGAGLGDLGADALERVDALRSELEPGPEGRVAAATELATLVSDVRAGVAALPDPAAQDLLGPLADAARTLRRERGELLIRLDDLAPVTEALVQLVAGPRDVLLLGANPAEMRNGSGMYLQSGLVRIDRGAISLSDVGSSYDQRVPDGAVMLDPAIDALYGWARPDIEWRNINLTPRFDASAELAADLWEASTGEPVDTVLAVDPVALAAVLELTGPVRALGRTLSADNVVDYLVFEQYEGLDDLFTPEEFQARRDELGEVATAALVALQDTAIDPLDLLEAFEPVVEGRHLLMWSSDPELAEGLEALGVTGELTPRTLAVGLSNLSGSKASPYVPVRVEMAVEPIGDELEVTLFVNVRNELRPEEVSRYVVGFAADELGGDHRGLLTVHAPAAASGLAFTGDREVVSRGDDGPTRQLSARVIAPVGGSDSAAIVFRIPADEAVVVIEPSARHRPVTWVLPDGSRVPDGIRTELDLAALVGG